MELKTFVAESLVQICEGIRDAQARTLGIGAYVCPLSTKDEMARPDGTVDVEFDVAVVAALEKGSESGRESGLMVAMASMFKAGIKGDSKSSDFVQNTNVSRLKFIIPVRWPLVEVKNEDELMTNFGKSMQNCGRDPRKV